MVGGKSYRLPLPEGFVHYQSSSHRSIKRGDLPSLPMTMAAGDLKSICVYSASPLRSMPMTQMLFFLRVSIAPVSLRANN
jgi:hypothetical protein